MVQVQLKKQRSNFIIGKLCILCCLAIPAVLLLTATFRINPETTHIDSQEKAMPTSSTLRQPKVESKVIQPKAESKYIQTKCSCVACDKDRICGGLWNGTRYTGMPEGDEIFSKEIHLVVSHCKADLNFMKEFTKGFDIASIHIISKCGKPVVGAPASATIQTDVPNIGRCDHSYAYYITSVLDEKLKQVSRKGKEEDAIVVFLKDNMNPENFHQPGHWNSLDNMIRIASSSNGFSCGVVTTHYRKTPNYAMSVYFDLEELKKFTLHRTYHNQRAEYESDGVQFQSVYKTLGAFYESLDAGPSPTNVVQVCYGGVFAATVRNIRQRKKTLWKTAETKLSRGDNILEGHYMERSWAMLLSTPLQLYQADAVQNYSNYKFLVNGFLRPYVGALVKRVPPFYSQKSSSSSD